MLNRLALTLVFTLSFLTYVAENLTASLMLVPLVLFAALVYVRVFLSKSALQAVGSLLDPDGLLYVLFIPALTFGSSLESTYNKSPGYWLVDTLCLILARLYLTVVSIRELFEAFFWSGILSVGIFTVWGFSSLMHSVETLERLEPNSFHPNFLGFVLAAYFCAMVWKLLTGGWVEKILAGLVSFLCLAIIFYASSRGAIVAILVGCLTVGAMAIVHAVKSRRKRFLRMGFLAIALLPLIAFSIQRLEWTQDAADFVDQVLSLSSPGRGIDSGFTGRADKWRTMTSVFYDGTWLLGRGIRSSSDMQPAIDNGYLVVLYELGVFPLILIVWRFLSILGSSVKGYFRAFTREQRRFSLACCLLIVVFLVNNIVERILFGVGNPLSLLALLLFVAPTSQLNLCLGASTCDPRLPGRMANQTAPNIQASS